MIESVTQLAKLLGLRDQRDLRLGLSRLEAISGVFHLADKVMQKIYVEKIRMIRTLCLSRSATPVRVHKVLIAHLERVEKELTKFLRTKKADCAQQPHATGRLFDLVRAATPYRRGWFLKVTVAKRIFKNHPPRGLMRHLGYSNVQKLIEHEDIFELFAAIRFSESKVWNTKLLGHYQRLKPSDFEAREIQTRVLDPDRWFGLAREFVTKKYHNLSHSKEMGVIFALPYPGHLSSMNLRALALVFHYFAEVHFYGELFGQARRRRNNFGREIVTAILGDVKHKITLAAARRSFCWPILQRYLAKDRKQDWRFRYPHVMPEALHWQRAISSLCRFGRRHRIVSLGLWRGDLDWVGFDGGGKLVTLNLEDLIFSSAMGLSFGRHLTYHWREALWNKLFAIAVGEKRLIELMQRDLSAGRICEL